MRNMDRKKLILEFRNRNILFGCCEMLYSVLYLLNNFWM